MEGISMWLHNPEIQSIVPIATIGSKDFVSPITRPILIPRDAGQLIEDDDGEQTVDIYNRPERDYLGRFVWEAMGRKDMSGMVLKVAVDNKRLGVVFFVAKGFNRYTKEHGRLVELLHDPFAIAFANTLHFQEIVRLKDLLLDDNRYLNRQLHQLSGDQIIGSRYGLKYVMEMVRQVAPQASQVLLLGETGVGKEVIANAIHHSSPRASGPLIKVNCGAIPENLIDSELFGHEKGAFTGALSLKRGRFERADKGTLFLDEIGELPLSAQVRLLRVIQNKEIERVGGVEPIPVDVRIIAATHRNLPLMVKQDEFREDLWFRLNVFPITIPPLRQRKSDIPALTNFFIEKKAREMNLQNQPVLAPGALENLQAYNWPGNVRELENIVERTLIQSLSGPADKPLVFRKLQSSITTDLLEEEPITKETPLFLDEVMRCHIEKVLKMTKGQVQGERGAAALLNIHPNTLRNRMKKLGISYGRKGASEK